MKSHKREREHRAFDHGYRAGVKGKSTEQCPYISVIDLRAVWMRGWREGREDMMFGIGISTRAQNE